jgi:hypothetical protein
MAPVVVAAQRRAALLGQLAAQELDEAEFPASRKS